MAWNHRSAGSSGRRKLNVKTPAGEKPGVGETPSAGEQNRPERKTSAGEPPGGNRARVGDWGAENGRRMMTEARDLIKRLLDVAIEEPFDSPQRTILVGIWHALNAALHGQEGLYAGEMRAVIDRLKGAEPINFSVAKEAENDDRPPTR